MTDDLETIAFRDSTELWAWLDAHGATHPGVWVRLEKTASERASIGFHDLLEAGIAYGWRGMKHSAATAGRGASNAKARHAGWTPIHPTWREGFPRA